MPFFERIKFNRTDIRKQNVEPLKIGKQAPKLHLPDQEIRVRIIPEIHGITGNMENMNNIGRTIKISQDDATLFKTHPWLEQIPEDAILSGETAKIFKNKLSKVIDAMDGLMPSIGVTGTKLKSIRVATAELKKIFKRSEGKTVRDTCKALIGVYTYLGVRAVGTVAVVGIPQISTGEKVIDGIAAAALFLGESVVRLRTTIGYQHSILEGLGRGPKYYDISADEKVHASGIEFNPNDLENPFKIFTDAPECMSVLYINEEPGVLERSIFGHFFIENKRQMMVVNSGGYKFEEFQHIVDTVKNWIEARKSEVLSAKARSISSRDAELSAMELLKLLVNIRTECKRLSDAYYETAVQDFGNMIAGSGAALDKELAQQILLHTRKWDEKISALYDHIENYEGGNVNADQLRRHISSHYDYLEQKFTFDIVINFRNFKTFDVGTYKAMCGAIETRLAGQNIDMNAPVESASFNAIVDRIIEESEDRDRPVSYLLSTIQMNNGNVRYDQTSASYKYNCIIGGKTNKAVLDELIMENLSRMAFEVPTKPAPGPRNMTILAGNT